MLTSKEREREKKREKKEKEIRGTSCGFVTLFSTKTIILKPRTQTFSDIHLLKPTFFPNITIYTSCKILMDRRGKKANHSSHRHYYSSTTFYQRALLFPCRAVSFLGQIDVRKVYHVLTLSPYLTFFCSSLSHHFFLSSPSFFYYFIMALFREPGNHIKGPISANRMGLWE